MIANSWVDGVMSGSFRKGRHSRQDDVDHNPDHVGPGLEHPDRARPGLSFPHHNRSFNDFETICERPRNRNRFGKISRIMTREKLDALSIHQPKTTGRIGYLARTEANAECLADQLAAQPSHE